MSSPPLNSECLDDESRDTVNEEIETVWQPTFRPTDIKKVDQEKKNGLSQLLSSRMSRSSFESRFLQSNQFSTSEEKHNKQVEENVNSKEAGSESLFNRSTKLNALLASRPSREKLQHLNVLKAPQGSSLPSFAHLQNRLEASQKKDKLNSFLMSRPNQQDLEKRRIIQSTAHAEDPLERLSTAKTVLSDFFLSRPNPEQLVNQKIITDIGDLPGGLTARQQNVLAPQHVSFPHTITSVSIGFSHSVFLDTAGAVWVCGSCANGRLGLGEQRDVFQPRRLEQTGTVTAISAGENHSAYIANGEVFIFGMGQWGRLGLGSQDDVYIPTKLSFPNNEQIVQVACGAYHTLFLSSSNKLYACGWNKNGRCGVGKQHSTLVLTIPVEVTFFSSQNLSVSHVYAGQSSSMAITADGKVWAWGSGAYGVLGNGDEKDSWDPIVLSLPGPVSSLSLGATHGLMVIGNDVLTWGSNDKSQLGRDEKAGKIAKVDGVHGNVSSVAAGKTHSCAVVDGALWSWGSGQRGVLGLGNEQDVHVPTRVTTLPNNIQQAAAAWTHTAVTSQDGKVWTMGSMNNGKLGH